MIVKKDKIKVNVRVCKDVELVCPKCGEISLFYDVDTEIENHEMCWECGEMLEFYVCDF